MTRVALAFLTAFSLYSPLAEAQITVQQPVVNRFSAQTNVSIPDRGEALLGGVNSARSSRTSFGPGRVGSSLSRDLQGSSMSAGVYIHDLAAMDEALLAQGTPDVDDSPNRFVDSLAVRHRTSRNNSVTHEEAATTGNSAKAQRFERLAQTALVRGNPLVARLHWQMAAKYGSQLAQRYLDEESAKLAISTHSPR